MKNQHQYIIVARKDYESKDEYNARLLQTLKTMLDNGYILVVREEEKDIVRFEYDYNQQSWGGPWPVWLTEDEQDAIENYRYEKTHKKKEE